MPQAPRVEVRESMTKIRSRGNRVVRIEPPGMSPSDAVKLMQLRYRLNGDVPDSDGGHVDIHAVHRWLLNTWSSRIHWRF